ncbi:MAG: hypothetical protein MUC28_00560 [Planctomycetes bacterium]|jgi:ABC-type Fe3+ transport system permease subunit|nr:hypothetical protein [Planctomycetota bacterium]
MEKVIKIQFFILLVGAIFAWSNFTIELFDWLNQQACTTGCGAGGEIKSPFLNTVFYGAIFITAAFFLNLILLFMNRRRKNQSASSSQPAEPAAGA